MNWIRARLIRVINEINKTFDQILGLVETDCKIVNELWKASGRLEIALEALKDAKFYLEEAHKQTTNDG